MDTYEKGHADFKPYFMVDEDTGKLVEVYLPADAVVHEARPGYKAGNPAIDELNAQLEQNDLLEKFKKLYRISKLKKE